MYQVEFNKGQWSVGGANCSDQEAYEYLKRGGTPPDNERRAFNIMRAIKRKAEANINKVRI